MEMIQLDCKGCSNACPLEIRYENDTVFQVDGNSCHRGPISADKQIRKRYQKRIEKEKLKK